jgi:DNA invertase Pin-like site-specific DNA recombinase
MEMAQEPIKYCLYARKSSEAEERQALSIDSQVNEMLTLAQRENLNIVDMYRESHSAKDCGQRPVYNKLLLDIREGKFDGILVWHPDRLARNAGDLGAVVDLLDQKKLVEIRTHSQRFTNNPNEKFLLMILGSQAKLNLHERKLVEVQRHKKFHSGIMGKAEETYHAKDADIRNYAKYLLTEGSMFEKRDLLTCLKSKICLENKSVRI